MKKLIYITFILIVFYSCKNKANNEEDNTIINTVQNIESNPKVENLTIIGDQIWVRTEPSTGEVVMKLDNGTKCNVIEKGEKQTIKGVTDFWYKIEYEGKEGWVFGSQTNLKTNEPSENKNSEKDEIIVFWNNIFENISKNPKSLSKYFLDDSLFNIYNPGAFPYVYHDSYMFFIEKFKDYNFDKYEISFVDNLPKFDMDDYKWKKEGNFITSNVPEKPLDVFWQLQYELGMEVAPYDDLVKEIDKNITHILLITSIDEGVYIYFGKYKGNWKIFFIDTQTHDA